MEIRQRKVSRLWRGLAIAFALFVIASNILYITYAFGDLAGTLGGRLTPVPAAEPGVVRVSAVAPGSPLANAGAADGAKVRLDQVFDIFRLSWPGEQVGLTLLDAAPPLCIEITVAPYPQGERLRLARFYQVDSLSALLAATVGLIILLRSGGALSLVVLGLAFAGFDYTAYSPLQNDPRNFAFWDGLHIANELITPLLFLDFALRFYRENVAPLARWVRPVFAVYAVVAALVGVAAYVSRIHAPVPAEAEFENLAMSVVFSFDDCGFCHGLAQKHPGLAKALHRHAGGAGLLHAGGADENRGARRYRHSRAGSFALRSAGGI